MDMVSRVPRVLVALVLLVGLVRIGAPIASAADPATEPAPPPSGLYAVLHPLNPTADLNEKKLRKLFIGSTRFWAEGDVSVIPYVRPGDSPAGDALMTVCRMSPQRFEALWTRKQLAGQGVKPREIEEVDEIVSTVSADPRAITVVTSDEADRIDTDTVKLLPVAGG
jgi:hypothetical protein